MKNRKFFFLTYIILFITIYFIFGIWGLFEINKFKNLSFKNKDNLIFHKKYSDQVHHLRDVNKWDNKNNNYLYSEIIFNENYENTILLQGDSWIEDISNIKKSTKFVKEFGESLKFNIYNAGVTSYSPSVMHAQYKVLKDQFNILPKLLVIHIDQTDIGDEKCRYKHNKIYSSDGKLIRVQREKYTRATYDYTKIYLYSDLHLSNNLVKIIKFPYLKFQYFLKRNIKLFNQISEKGFKQRNESKCGFYEIQKELINYDPKSEKIFKKSLNEYLEFLSKEENIEKIYLTSFPHIWHFNKNYKVNVSKYIDEVLTSANNEKFVHINMSNLDFSGKDVELFFRKNDVASHLNDEYHAKIFLKNIFSNIDNYFKK